MSLKLKTDALNVFLGEEFGEDITYTPGGGSAKTIKAIVAKDALGPGSENSGRTLRNQAEVYIANDTVKGMSEINRRDDRLSITDREGSVRTVRVARVIGSDTGMWHLLVEW